MKKKGFTLIELLSVVVVLGLLAFLVIPLVGNVLNDSRNDFYEKQLNLIKSATKLWANEEENKIFLQELTVWPYELTLGDLQESGFIEKNIKNPLSTNNEIFHENMIIQINKVGNSYEYTILDEQDPLSPIIILNGDSIQNVEIMENYVEQGASAISSNGDDLEVTISFRQNGLEVDNIDTTKLGNYRVVYKATDAVRHSSVMRTIKIIDTTAPVLTCDGCPDNNEVRIYVQEEYQLPTVTAVDNSGEEIQVYKTGSFSNLIAGERTIVYTATDSSGNKSILSLNVIIMEKLS